MSGLETQVVCPLCQGGCVEEVGVGVVRWISASNWSESSFLWDSDWSILPPGVYEPTMASILSLSEAWPSCRPSWRTSWRLIAVSVTRGSSLDRWWLHNVSWSLVMDGYRVTTASWRCVTSVTFVITSGDFRVLQTQWHFIRELSDLNQIYVKPFWMWYVINFT